jgi:hypothetical protein
MKFIKKLKVFINEAKIKDVILKTQADKIKSRWGEKFLYYEEIEPTKNIIQGKWKLSEEDKNKVLSAFFNDINMETLFDTFDGISDHLSELIIKSIDLPLIEEKNNYIYKKVEEVLIKNFNPKKPYIDQIILMNKEAVFKKLLVNETKKDEIIKRDEDGKPIFDEDGNMIKIKKEKGDPVFDKNLTDLNGFIESYNRSYNTKYNFDIYEIRSIVDILSNKINDHYNVDFNIFDKDVYLLIRHKPHDILNMSISKFYSSCQHLYTGSYSSQLLSNVFDPNSIPAFLIFETPIYDDNEKISDFLPLSRMMIRNIHQFETDEKVIFFDKTYPDRVRDIFYEIVEKYSDNKKNIRYDNYTEMTYVFSPDIEVDDHISEPYMDKLNLKQYLYIGKNTKKLFLNRNINWSKTIISPNAVIEELIIETEDIPENTFDVLKNVKWVKFRYLTIKNLEIFKDIIKQNIYFDKCKISDNVIEYLSEFNLNKLNITSCNVNISLIKNLKVSELYLLYTLNTIEEIYELIENNEIKTIYISGDMIKTKKDLNNLKSKYPNINIKISGLSLI